MGLFDGLYRLYIRVEIFKRSEMIRGVALRGAANKILQWPAARRLQAEEYPDSNIMRENFGNGLYENIAREFTVPLYFEGEPMVDEILLTPRLKFKCYYSLGGGIEEELYTYSTVTIVKAIKNVTRGQQGWWADFTLVSGYYYFNAFNDEFTIPPVAPPYGLPSLPFARIRNEGGDEVEILRHLGVGCYAGWPPGEVTQLRNLPFARLLDENKLNLWYRLAPAPGEFSARCVMAREGTDVPLVLRYYMAARVLLMQRDYFFDTYADAAGVTTYGTRYVSQEVVGFYPAEGLLFFDITFKRGVYSYRHN